MSQPDSSAKPKRKLPTWIFAALILVSVGAKFLKAEHKQEVRAAQQAEQVVPASK
jgi:hypothetical protein